MLQEQKFHLDEKQVEFLARYREYGFKDKSQLVVAALQRFELELESRELPDSALEESPRVEVGELSGMLYQADRKTVSLEEMEEGAQKQQTLVGISPENYPTFEERRKVLAKIQAEIDGRLKKRRTDIQWPDSTALIREDRDSR